MPPTDIDPSRLSPGDPGANPATAGARETGDLIGSDKVEGTPVRRPDGTDLGVIKRVMIEKRSGRVAYAVMSFGGFLGLGEDHYPVPWGALRYEPDLGAYVLDAPDDQLRGAPRLDEGAMGDRGANGRLADHWNVPPYWVM